MRDTSQMNSLPEADGLRVSRCDDRAQYELHDGDELLTFAPFTEADGVLTVPHIETLVQHRCNGYSSILMDGLIDDLRSRGLRIEPTCVVVRGYVRALPDADELMVR
jgi:predicted GNAT family acetyltransferase